MVHMASDSESASANRAAHAMAFDVTQRPTVYRSFILDQMN